MICFHFVVVSWNEGYLNIMSRKKVWNLYVKVKYFYDNTDIIYLKVKPNKRYEDFSFQEYYILTISVLILPGDILFLTLTHF